MVKSGGIRIRPGQHSSQYPNPILEWSEHADGGFQVASIVKAILGGEPTVKSATARIATRRIRLILVVAAMIRFCVAQLLAVCLDSKHLVSVGYHALPRRGHPAAQARCWFTYLRRTKSRDTRPVRFRVRGNPPMTSPGRPSFGSLARPRHHSRSRVFQNSGRPDLDLWLIRCIAGPYAEFGAGSLVGASAAIQTRNSGSAFVDDHLYERSLFASIAFSVTVCETVLHPRSRWTKDGSSWGLAGGCCRPFYISKTT